MPRRPKGSLPSYRLHKQSGQAIVSLPLGGGKYKDILLGPYGSPESHEEYRRVLAEWQANRHQPPAPPGGVTVAELILRYVRHAAVHYRDKDGNPTGELNPLKLSLRPLNFLHPGLPAAEFDPLNLRAVRQLMIDGYEHPEYGVQPPLSRKLINQRVGRIKAMFRWAVGQKLVPVTVYQALLAVEGLSEGRSEARETDDVEPVAWDVVEATLPQLNPVVRSMILFQSYTGARPGEVCKLRPRDLDRGGDVWVYRPGKHKTKFRGHERNISIGPKAQAVLEPFLRDAEPERFVFSPAAAVALVRQQARARRKTKVQPSQECRKKAAPRRKPGERYTTASYGRAVARGIKKHNREEAKKAAKEGRDPRLLPHWHPHQLRHTFGTEARKLFGAEAAQTALGHRQMSATEIYAEKNLALAAQVAKAIG